MHVSCCSLNSCSPERKRSGKLLKRENKLRLFTGLAYLVQRLKKNLPFKLLKPQRSRYENATSIFCWVFCALSVSCAINRGVFLRLHSCRRTFASLWGPCLRLPHFNALTHAVIRVSSAFIFQTFVSYVCWGPLFCLRKAIKRSSFKSFLRCAILSSLGVHLFKMCCIFVKLT